MYNFDNFLFFINLAQQLYGSTGKDRLTDWLNCYCS